MENNKKMIDSYKMIVSYKWLIPIQNIRYIPITWPLHHLAVFLIFVNISRTFGSKNHPTKGAKWGKTTVLGLGKVTTKSWNPTMKYWGESNTFKLLGVQSTGRSGWSTGWNQRGWFVLIGVKQIYRKNIAPEMVPEMFCLFRNMSVGGRHFSRFLCSIIGKTKWNINIGVSRRVPRECSLQVKQCTDQQFRARQCFSVG